MILVNGKKIERTIFPDGTSQVWKLGGDLLDCGLFNVVWRFEEERELIDLFSLKLLLDKCGDSDLFIPYLPFARQDKFVDNGLTFNLKVLAGMLNQMKFSKVYATDAHNHLVCESLIDNFYNQPVEHLIRSVIDKEKISGLVFPDKGASKRYKLDEYNKIVFSKIRDQRSGKIKKIIADKDSSSMLLDTRRLLIVDDICDGGATFEACATEIKKQFNSAGKVFLYVTHGIFSKGVNGLKKSGINKIYATNSFYPSIKQKGVNRI